MQCCQTTCQLPSKLAWCAQQEELEALFIQLDKVKGRATSSLGKGELGDALKAFFRVGQPGGKSEERHDELMQVRFLDFPGFRPSVSPRLPTNLQSSCMHAL